MPVDPNRGRQIQSLMARTRAMLPRLADEALNSGDFSKVDDANATIDRLSQIGQKFVDDAQGQQGPQGQEGTAGVPGQSPDPSQGLTSRMLQQPTPVASSNPQSEDELIRAKRLAEAENLPKGRLASLPTAVPQQENPYAGMAAGGGFGGPSAQLMRSAPTTYRPHSETLKESLATPNFNAIGRVAGPSLMNAFQTITGNTEPIPEKKAVPSPVTLASTQDNYSDDEGNNAATQSLDSLLSEPADAQATSPEEPDLSKEDQNLEATPDITKVAPDITKVAPEIAKEYNGDSKAALIDISKYASAGDPQEQEFLRRVQMELGPRPKMFTVEKLLAALALGAGSIVGAWMTKRYNGQALLDNDEPQREYDRAKQKIGSEVAAKYARQEQADANQTAMMGRIAYLQNRLDDREGVKQGGYDKRLDAKGVQALAIQNAKDAASMERLKAKLATVGQAEISKWPDSDKREFTKLAQNANRIEREILQLTNPQTAMFSADPAADARRVAMLRAEQADTMRQMDILNDSHRATGTVAPNRVPPKGNE